MKCSKAHTLISLSIDGKLEKGEHEELDSHIRECGDCSRYMAEVRQFHETFIHVEKLEAPPGFSTKLMAHIRSGETERRSGVPLLTRFAEAVIMAAIIVAGIFSGSLLMNTAMPAAAQKASASLSLDLFDSAPAGSISGAYLSMAEAKDER